MAQYIDKAAVVAEIEERIDRDNERAASYSSNSENDYFCRVKEKVYKSLLSFLDTIEVKEVDLEKEINKYISDNFFGSQTLGFFANRTKEEPNDQDIALCAKHFFELGMCASNPITVADRGIQLPIVTVKEAIERKIINSPFALRGAYSGKMLFYSWKKSISKMPENIANLKLTTNYDYKKGELDSYSIKPMVRFVESSFDNRPFLEPYVLVWVSDYELAKKGK